MILLAGGTGTLGRKTLPLLTRRGFRVRILTRHPDRARDLKSDRVEVVSGDVRDSESLDHALFGAQTVISAMSGYGPRSGGDPRTVDGEGNRNLIMAAAKAGARHFVLVSVRGAGPDHPMELMRMKYLAELELRRSNVPWTIIRPSLLMETCAMVVGEPLLKGGKSMVLGRGDNPINFVSVSDVARVVERSVVDESLRGVEVDVCGPENLTLRQFATAFATVVGKPDRCRHVSRAALRLMATAARPLSPVFARLAHDAIVMDTFDFTCDVRGAGRWSDIRAMTLAEVVSRDYLSDPTGIAAQREFFD